MSAFTLSSTQSADGINLSWTYTGFSNAISKLSVLYFNQTDVTNVNKVALSAAQIKDGNYAIPATSLIAGKSYLFSLQGVDTANGYIVSNTATVTSPYAMNPPTLTGFVGTNNQIVLNVTNPTFASGDAGLTGSNAKIAFVFIDVPAVTPPVVFEISKPYGQTSYTLTSSDNALIKNEQIYEVAAYIIPDPADTTHTQSAISNSIRAYASEKPNAPVLLDPTQGGIAFSNIFSLSNTASNSDWCLSWTAPSDQASWSLFGNQKIQANFYLKKVSDASYPATPNYTVDVSTLSELKYEFRGLEVANYSVVMSYTNDTGEGAKSNAVTWYNYTAALAPTNVVAVVDPSNQVLNLTWTPPSNINTLVNFNKYVIYYTIGVNTTIYEILSSSASSYNIPIPTGNLGNVSDVSLFVKNISPSGFVYTGRASGTITTRIYSLNTATLSSTTAVASDGKIDITWNNRTSTDGNDRTAKKARIVITQGGLSQTIEGAGGSYSYSAVNGLSYNVSIYDEAVSPVGNVLVSSIAAVWNFLVPQSQPAALSNFIATATGDGQLTLSWSDVVSSSIASFKYQYGGNTYTTTSNSVVLSSLTNGQSYSFTAYAVNGLGVNGVSSTITAIPFTVPTITNVVKSGTTVTCSFNPKGNTIQSFEVLALPAVPKISDGFFLQSTVPIVNSYQANGNTSPFAMNFAFPSLSANISVAIILISYLSPTGVTNTVYYNSLIA